MQRQMVSDSNTDRIINLIQEAGQDGCPICLGIGAVMAEAGPLTDQFGSFGWDKIVCSRNKYHVCSVEGVSTADYLVISIMDRLDREVKRENQ